MNTPFRLSQSRERLAAFGGALAMTLVVMAGIGTLAEVEPASELQVRAAPALLQVVVVGQRPQALSIQPQQILVVGQRARRS